MVLFFLFLLFLLFIALINYNLFFYFQKIFHFLQRLLKLIFRIFSKSISFKHLTTFEFTLILIVFILVFTLKFLSYVQAKNVFHVIPYPSTLIQIALFSSYVAENPFTLYATPGISTATSK